MRVMLVDDHLLFRRGMEVLFERSGIEVAASVGDGWEAIRKAREVRPDAILLDLRMDGLDGLTTLDYLQELDGDPAILVLTMSEDEEDLISALRSGACGYLLKDSDPEAVVTAVQRAVSEGGCTVTPRLSGTLATVIRDRQDTPEPTDPLGGLTLREREVLAHLGMGKSNKVIARALDISDGTVKLHVKAILHKLGVRSRVEAALFAAEHGLAKKADA